MRERACRDCPFRRDGIKHLDYRADDVAAALAEGRRFHCHNTLELGEDGIDTANGSACIGALRVLTETGGPDLFDSLEEFVETQHA